MTLNIILGGYYKCKCGSEFFNINRPLHRNGCNFFVSSNLTYFFGPREGKRALLSGNSVFSSLKKEDIETLLTEKQRKYLLETPDNRLFSKETKLFCKLNG